MDKYNYECQCENMRQNIEQFIKNTKDDWNYITPTDFYNNYYNNPAKKYLLIDLRKKEEFDKYHVKNAVNIFWMDIFKKKYIETLKKISKSMPIFLICYVGHTSSQTLVLLRMSGVNNVVSIKFGYGISPVFGVPVAGWLQYRYPVHSNNLI